jgi:hypothetical protein
MEIVRLERAPGPRDLSREGYCEQFIWEHFLAGGVRRLNSRSENVLQHWETAVRTNR